MRRLLIALSLLAATGCSTTPPPQAAAPPPPALIASHDSGHYPLKECVVSGEKLDQARLVYTWKGREVQFCCSDCVAQFKQNPEKYLARIDAATK